MKVHRKRTTPAKPQNRAGVKLGDLFRRRRERGRAGLPLMSVTLNDGLVERRTLDRKTGSGLSPEHHLLIRKGDIAYNMMRMWQGALGLAEHEGLVSPAYVVLAPKTGVDSKFAAYWFKSPRMVHLFWAYSYGLAKDRLRLYFRDLARIPVTPPSPERQPKIAAILESWDRAINQTYGLIAAKEKLKKGLLQKLLTGMVRLRSFSSAWTPLKLGDVGKFSKGAGVSKSDAVADGVPAVRYGELYTTHSTIIREFHTRISPQSTKSSHKISSGDILIAGSGETPEEIGKAAVFLGDFDAYAGGDIVILSPKKADPVFLSYVLNSAMVRRFILSRAQGQSVFHLYRRDLEHLPLRLPGITEQSRIARVLMAVDREITILQTQAEKLREQQRGLLQRLMTRNGAKA